MEKLITVTTFEYPQESYIIKSKLESEGIYVFLKDELYQFNFKMTDK